MDENLYDLCHLMHSAYWNVILSIEKRLNLKLFLSRFVENELNKEKKHIHNRIHSCKRTKKFELTFGFFLRLDETFWKKIANCKFKPKHTKYSPRLLWYHPFHSRLFSKKWKRRKFSNVRINYERMNKIKITAVKSGFTWAATYILFKFFSIFFLENIPSHAHT